MIRLRLAALLVDRSPSIALWLLMSEARSRSALAMRWARQALGHVDHLNARTDESKRLTDRISARHGR